MIHKILMPRLGANIDEAKIIKWHKSIGDPISKGEILVEVDTDKASFEIEADETGVLRHIAVENGKTVSYNHPLAIIANAEENIDLEIDALNSSANEKTPSYTTEMDKSVFDNDQLTEQNHSTNEIVKKSKIATPKAIAIANESGITHEELTLYAQSRPRGFVTEKDIKNLAQLRPTYIYGASTGAKQIMEIIDSGAFFRVTGLIDDNTDLHEMSIKNIPVIGDFETLKKISADREINVLVSSHSHNRRKIIQRIEEELIGVHLPPVIDARAIILSDVKIGAGALIEAGCVIGHEVSIGKGAILNIGAKLSHNCQIGDFTHLTIGTSLSGAVRVGRNCLIGAGSSINPDVEIGDNSIVTPGSAILNNLPDNVVATGVPAHIIGASKRGAV